MKKTKTTYEKKSKKVSYIKCDHCETTWDDRDTGLAEDMNIVASNVKIYETLSSLYSGWSTAHVAPNGDVKLYRDHEYKLECDEKVEVCNTCLEKLLSPASMVKVTEEEYYVKENVEDVYYCDLDESSIGGSVDYEIYVNPTLDVVERYGSITNNGATNTQRINLGSAFRTSSRRSDGTLSYDEKYDVCNSCAASIFNKQSLIKETTASGSKWKFWKNWL